VFLQEGLRNRGVDLGRLRLRLLARIPPLGSTRLLQLRPRRRDAIEVCDVEEIPVPPELRRLPLMQWPEDLGPIASSVYFSTPEWVERHRAEAVGLTRAMGRALRWLQDRGLDESSPSLS
jgi:hypothetical protein